jgi:hypothetical protein
MGVSEAVIHAGDHVEEGCLAEQVTNNDAENRADAAGSRDWSRGVGLSANADS